MARKIASLAALIALALWVVWWGIALVRLDLPLAGWSNFVPLFGCDFTTQTDYAARTWSGFADPYADHRHLFHYPPIVIRLFAWTPYLSIPAALRIWVVVLALLIVAGTFVAWQTRKELELEPLPLPVALAGVLFSFPVVFALERANFDLITLAAILLAVRLDRRGGPFAEIAAGCLLAVGPWVKIYPGLIGVGLLALRRYRVLGGFVAGGIAIGLAAPAETLRSLEVLRLAMERSRDVPFGSWSHSLSLAWINVGFFAAQAGFSAPAKVPSALVAGAVVAPALAWVCWRVHRCEERRRLTYPLLLWVVALGTFVPEIANDYSLVFLPLAVVAVYGRRDPLLVHVAMALLLLPMQPIALPLNPFLLLSFKLAGVLAVGAMLVRRARELGGAATTAAVPSEPSPRRESEMRAAGAVHSRWRRVAESLRAGPARRGPLRADSSRKRDRRPPACGRRTAGSTPWRSVRARSTSGARAARSPPRGNPFGTTGRRRCPNIHGTGSTSLPVPAARPRGRRRARSVRRLPA
jgi:hypothetical protein